MAEYYNAPEGADFAQDFAPQSTLTPQAKRLTGLTNAAGAIVSLALVAGIGVWGYKLLVRDVSGIPVVRAAQGEMRVRPEEPGGQLAQHQGLSVNEVAAVGTAAAPADQLRLAPQPVGLAEEDQVIPVAMVAPTPQVAPAAAAAIAPVNETPDVAAALQSGNVDDLVAQLTAGVTPLSNALEEAPAQVIATVTDTLTADVAEAQAAVVQAVFSGPSPKQSLRPRKRPAQTAQVVQASAPAPTAERDAASLPAGTRLAQLGAFDSEEVAREQWDQLSTRFSAYLGDKERIIQKASSGGRTFYRLRAMGFEDIGDARRFCSALVAENADCIPVVTR